MVDAADAEDKPRAIQLWGELEKWVDALRANKDKFDEEKLNVAIKTVPGLREDVTDEELLPLRREIESAMGYEFTPEYQAEINLVFTEVITGVRPESWTVGSKRIELK